MSHCVKVLHSNPKDGELSCSNRKLKNSNLLTHPQPPTSETLLIILKQTGDSLPQFCPSSPVLCIIDSLLCGDQ